MILVVTVKLKKHLTQKKNILIGQKIRFIAKSIGKTLFIYLSVLGFHCKYNAKLLRTKEIIDIT